MLKVTVSRTHSKLLKELVNGFRSILIIILKSIVDAIFQKVVNVNTFLQDNRGRIRGKQNKTKRAYKDLIFSSVSFLKKGLPGGHCAK